jgi:hypothetical protein
VISQVVGCVYFFITEEDILLVKIPLRLVQHVVELQGGIGQQDKSYHQGDETTWDGVERVLPFIVQCHRLSKEISVP